MSSHAHTHKLDKFGIAALTGLAPVNDHEWQSWRAFCTNCSATLFPLRRSHCRFCGQLFCTSCVTVLDPPPTSLGVCEDAPTSGPCKACAACTTKARFADALCEALRVLLVLTAAGAHAREWHAIANACPRTTPLGLAARFLLVTYDRATGPRAQFGPVRFRPSALQRELVATSGPFARVFDLVYNTSKAQTRLAVRDTDAPLELPVCFFLPILAHGAINVPWCTEMFNLTHSAMWACVNPCLHPRMRIGAFGHTTRAQRRAICLNMPAGDPSQLSKTARKHEQVRRTLETVLACVVLDGDARKQWWQGDRDFGDVIRDVDQPPVVYGDDQEHNEALVLTGARKMKDCDWAVQLVVGTEPPVVAHFTACKFDLVRAAAFIGTTGMRDMFMRQVVLGAGARQHRVCIMPFSGVEAGTKIDVASCSEQSRIVQRVLLTILQASHRRYVDTSKLRQVHIDGDEGCGCVCVHAEFLAADAPAPEPATDALADKVLRLIVDSAELCHWANVLLHVGSGMEAPDLPTDIESIRPFVVHVL